MLSSFVSWPSDPGEVEGLPELLIESRDGCSRVCASATLRTSPSSKEGGWSFLEPSAIVSVLFDTPSWRLLSSDPTPSSGVESLTVGGCCEDALELDLFLALDCSWVVRSLSSSMLFRPDDSAVAPLFLLTDVVRDMPTSVSK